MSRSARLLDLLQCLRRHRRPVTGRTLAAEMGISIRTLYRDIATLQGQGAPIEGEPGLGYVLRSGFMLPPLMLSEEEIEALVLGARWVAHRADARLALAACNAVAKISAVLPTDLQDTLDTTPLIVPSWSEGPVEAVDLSVLRDAIRRERVLTLTYQDAKGDVSERQVWPFALGFFDRARMMVAWCELRAGFRHFRTDRIIAATILDRRYPQRRQALLKSWRETEEIPTATI